MRKFKVGDYVEVLDGASGRIEVGEQGLIIEDEEQGSLAVIFPARDDHWASDERKPLGNFGWLVRASYLKLLYRPSSEEEEKG